MLNQDFNFNFRQPFECNDKLIEFLSQSFMLSAIIFTAVEYKLFDAIEKNFGVPDDIVKDVNISPKQLKKLMDACASLDLIKIDNGLYQNSPSTTRLLTANSTTNILPVVTHYSKHVYGLFGLLPQALSQGKNQVKAWSFATDSFDAESSDMYSELSKNPDEYQRFIKAMNHFSLGVGKRIAQDIDFKEIKTLADLGCGGGRVSVDIALEVPDLNITLVDKEQVLEVARSEISYAGVSEQFALMPGDIFQVNLPESHFDAVLISAVLGDWDKDCQKKILGSARRILKPGGLLIVSETLSYESGGPLLPALLSLYVLVLTQGGENFSYESLSSLLYETGFRDINLFDNKALGLRDTVIAFTPMSQS